MPTFMQSLKKEIGGNRRGGGHPKNTYSGYKKNHQNQPPGDRSPKPDAYSVPLAQLEDLLNDNMISIRKFIEQVMDMQKYLVESDRNRARFETETATTLKRIADMLSALLDRQDDSHRRESFSLAHSATMPQTETISIDLPNPEHYRYVTVNRKDMVQKIIAMREQGLTYRLIAEYLERNGIPTFSGRGGWHAQTIANLIKFSKAEQQAHSVE